jgi:hypothetical protein
MKTEPQWLSTAIAPEIIENMEEYRGVWVEDKRGSKTKAKLTIENNDGLIAVLAHYEFDSYSDRQKKFKFYLTQEELDGLLNAYVLKHPDKHGEG